MKVKTTEAAAITKAATILRKIFDSRIMVPNVAAHDRDAALWLAITILEGR